MIINYLGMTNTKPGPTYMRSMEIFRLLQLIQSSLSDLPGVASDADQRAYRHDKQKRQNSAHLVGLKDLCLCS